MVLLHLFGTLQPLFKRMQTITTVNTHPLGNPKRGGEMRIEKYNHQKSHTMDG